ncbi:unnamed protein product [Parascedosporium putredinis]|uniref:Uncharacterized protein n=1 Tax=Parascedosporium putredinis TaxID=1442378 RepID=A0A9P1MAV2_9PEZI|nr:unnamed protein product [Parascedosporium putredinis]CAI7995042.1 unnamed protein product [Parascedosporium putredinis]
MRAYFCMECSIAYSNRDRSDLWDGTGYEVFGFTNPADQDDLTPAVHFNDPTADVDDSTTTRGSWRGALAMDITGCDCMDKIMSRRLCAYHRVYLSERMVWQGCVMQWWRGRTFGCSICPMCQERPGLDGGVQGTALPEFHAVWICLVCNGAVIDPEVWTGTRRLVVTDRTKIGNWFGGHDSAGWQRFNYLLDQAW